MTKTIGTKARKKHLSSQPETTVSPHLEKALLNLESVCLRVLETRFSASRDDVESLASQQRFKNIITPVSLALRECRGPRHFHNHYRHREDDASVLHPVLEDPLDQLAHVCERALSACQTDFLGVYDDKLVKARRLLEQSLQAFLQEYEEQKEAVE